MVASVKRYKDKIKHPARQVGAFVNDAIAPATMMFCAEDNAKAVAMGGVAALWYGAHAAALFAPWAAKAVEGYEYYHNLIKDPAFLELFTRPWEERLQDQYSLIGTPERVAAGVRAYQEIGVDQVICMVQVGRIPHDEILNSLRLFGKEVIPRFRDG